MQFTEKYIQALKPKTARYDLREKSGDGFGIRVSPTGEKSWTFFYTFEGRKRRMTLGPYPSLTLADARIKYRAALKTLHQDQDPGLEKQKKLHDSKTALTIESLVSEYIEKWAKPRKRSWCEDQRILQKELTADWGKRKAKDISKRDIILLLDVIKDRGSPISANRTLAVIRRMFNFAVEQDIITVSPCTSIKAPAKENRRDRILNLEEIKVFWIGLEEAPMAELIKLALKLQLITAQRKGEVVMAEWSEIDLNSGWWTIPASKAKNGNLHRVPLSKLAKELLLEIKRLAEDSHWLFPSDKTKSHITPTAIDHAMRRCMTSFSNVESFTPHDLRRTAASHMTSIGIPRLVVSKILNHVESSVTAIYDRHSYDNEKQQALELLADSLNSILLDRKN